MDYYISFLLLFSFPSVQTILLIIVIGLLLLCSALVSGSEIAFFSLSPDDLEKIAHDNTLNDKRLLGLKSNPQQLLATILISNNFINIAIVILSDYLVRTLFPESIMVYWATQLMSIFSLQNWLTVEMLAIGINISLTVVGVTALVVLFGEIAPKVYANLNNVYLAKFMSSPLFLLNRLFSPFSSILVRMTSIIEKRLVRSGRGTGLTSREDIDEAIELTVSSEEDSEQDLDILKGIVKFGDVSVKQIMRSRVDVVAVDIQSTYQELLNTIVDSGYSRIPVYDENFDSIKGIMYAKDLIGHLNESPGFEWQTLIRPDIVYVPEAKKIKDLLKEFQYQRMHMAIVVDEYGGSSGIVTLEDIMEEVIGEIKDEFDDQPEIIYKKIDDFNYLFEGKSLLNDVCKLIGADINTFDSIKGDADSIAGLILEIKGVIPKAETSIEYQGYRLKVVSSNKRRIEQVLITLPD